MKNKNLAPVETIAKLLLVSERRVQQLAKDKIIPKPTRAKYELIGCVQGYINFLQDKLAGKDSESLDGKKEKARLTKLQADKVGIEVEILLEKFVELDLVEQHLSTVFASIRQKCLSLPTKIAPSIQAKKTVASIRKVLETEINEILNELCNYDPTTESTRNRKPVPGDKKKRGKAKATAKADGKRVGK